MTNLAEQVATALAGTSRARDLRVGVAVEIEDDQWLLNVGGAELEAWWPDDYYPADGDTVIAAMVGETWHVVAPIQRDPAPVPPIMGRVKTVPTGASRITVTVAGVDMDLAFLSSYTPVVGHDVALLWQPGFEDALVLGRRGDRKSTRLNSSHVAISYAVFCLKKKKNDDRETDDYIDTQ